MKKLLIAFLLIPNFIFAQPVERALIEAHCMDLKSLETLLKEFNEIPFIRGESHRDGIGILPFVLFMNPETKSWTLTEKVERNKYCVISLGQNLHAVPKEIREELEKERKGNKL